MDQITQLRAALKASPDNLPLRQLLANTLLQVGRYEEAELEWKAALQINPHEETSKIGLAEAFWGQSKTSLGLVIMEEVTEKGNASAEAWLVFAKLLLQGGYGSEAIEAYNHCITINSELADAFFEAALNQHAEAPDEPERIKLGGSISEEEDQKERSIEVERPKITFDEVGGMEEVKKEIEMKIIKPLEHPEIYKAYGKKIGGGILLYGPPGCGKTHLARATAGQVNANFISVGISDVLDMWLGSSEKNLHAIFQKARQLRPTVLFFDEVDALGANRNDMKHSAGRNTINQFLAELDGVEYNNEGLLILAATNAPWALDPAFRRPGRFDRIIFIPPPDLTSREAILNIKLSGKPVDNIDVAKIASKTNQFSGADLEVIIDLAIEGKLEESMQQGRPLPIGTDDLLKAIKRHSASTREWFSSAKNYALFANDSGLYDDILKYLKL